MKIDKLNGKLFEKQNTSVSSEKKQDNSSIFSQSDVNEGVQDSNPYKAQGYTRYANSMYYLKDREIYKDENGKLVKVEDNPKTDKIDELEEKRKIILRTLGFDDKSVSTSYVEDFQDTDGNGVITSAEAKQQYIDSQVDKEEAYDPTLSRSRTNQVGPEAQNFGEYNDIDADGTIGIRNEKGNLSKLPEGITTFYNSSIRHTVCLEKNINGQTVYFDKSGKVYKKDNSYGRGIEQLSADEKGSFKPEELKITDAEKKMLKNNESPASYVYNFKSNVYSEIAKKLKINADYDPTDAEQNRKIQVVCKELATISKSTNFAKDDGDYKKAIGYQNDTNKNPKSNTGIVNRNEVAALVARLYAKKLL